ncbi:MAG: hypothetical protein WDW36_004174 [Sanguina aurantia]
MAQQLSVPLLIDGKFVTSEATEHIDVLNPATQALLCRVPITTTREFNAAVQSAKDAFPKWRDTALPTRARVMFKFQELIRANMDVLAASITSEQGKTLADAKGDVFRGLEVVEAACGIAPFMMGEMVENVATGIDCYSIRQPLGVVAGICPFNFPAMVPLWMFPMAITSGNTFVLKPSEKDPGAAHLLAELAMQAGLPKGVLNIVHGSHGVVNAILDHPDIKAISFVGSNTAGRHIYTRGCANGKRVQSNMGAKNHAVVMQDADVDSTVKALTGAAFGAAGQRCMAISAAVFVGGMGKFREPLLAHATGAQGAQGGGGGDHTHCELTKSGCFDSVRVSATAARLSHINAGHEPNTDVGPLISKQSKLRCEALIASSIQQGAVCELDGRGVVVPGYERGNFVGPTLMTGVSAATDCYHQEVFGPVLSCMEVDTLDQAIAVVNANEHGNGCAIFTRSGGAARRFQNAVEVGMVGINVPIPVPLPFFSFTGWRGSFAGDLHMYGKAGVQFYTQPKTITSKWAADDAPAAPSNERVPGLDKVGA